MSYSREDLHERMRERYEDYMEQKRKEEQEEKYEENYAADHTGGGVPLYKLVHVTNINYLSGGFAAVNWNAETNQFLICEPGHDDWAIDRTEENLRALAHILAFDPKMWGCHRCGCSAEFKDQERVCGCDTCQRDGCCARARITHEECAPRVKSQYFMKRRGSLPPPPIVPLKRQSAVCSSNTFFESAPISPKSTSPHRLSAEDELRFKSF